MGYLGEEAVIMRVWCCSGVKIKEFGVQTDRWSARSGSGWLNKVVKQEGSRWQMSPWY